MNALVPTSQMMGTTALTSPRSTFPVTPWDGNPISVPGFYSDVSSDAYHKRPDICVGPSVSSGGLRKIDDKSPLHYFEDSPYNIRAEDEEDERDEDDKKEEKKESEALIFGRACHTLLLGESGFKEEYLIRPDTYPNDPTKKWSGNATDCKNYLAQAKLDGKTVLTKKQIKRIEGMAESLSRHPSIMQGGLLQGLVEKSGFCRDPKTGVWLKIRPDCLPEDDDTIVDLKSCASADPIFVRRAISDHGYHMQLALADMVIRETTGRQMREHILVFVESKPPYAINIKPIRPEAIAEGYAQNRAAIDLFAEAIKTGYWPGYDDDDEVPADLTPRLMDRLRGRREQGKLGEVTHAG